MLKFSLKVFLSSFLTKLIIAKGSLKTLKNNQKYAIFLIIIIKTHGQHWTNY